MMDFEIGKINWPRKDDKAFIGNNDPNSSVLACLDWLKYSFNNGQLIDSFKRAGDKIVTELERKEDMFHADLYFFPICYLYRHCIELHLKSIIDYGIRLDIIKSDDKTQKLLESHNLYRLWNKAEYVLKEFYSTSPTEDLYNARNILLQFHELDKTGQAFRYSHDKKGKSVIDNAPTRVNLKNLKDVFDGLDNFLSATQHGLSDALDYCMSNSD